MKKNFIRFQNTSQLQKWKVMYSAHMYPVTGDYVAGSAKQWGCKDERRHSPYPKRVPTPKEMTDRYIQSHKEV